MLVFARNYWRSFSHSNIFRWNCLRGGLVWVWEMGEMGEKWVWGVVAKVDLPAKVERHRSTRTDRSRVRLLDFVGFR